MQQLQFHDSLDDRQLLLSIFATQQRSTFTLTFTHRLGVRDSGNNRVLAP